MNLEKFNITMKFLDVCYKIGITSMKDLIQIKENFITRITQSLLKGE